MPQSAATKSRFYVNQPQIPLRFQCYGCSDKQWRRKMSRRARKNCFSECGTPKYVGQVGSISLDTLKPDTNSNSSQLYYLMVDIIQTPRYRIFGLKRKQGRGHVTFLPSPLDCDVEDIIYSTLFAVDQYNSKKNT